MSHATILVKDRFRALLPGYAWISSLVFAILFSLSPAPSMAGLGHVTWGWGVPRPFLSVFQNSENPGHTPLQGAYYWERWYLPADLLFWLFGFLFAAFVCTAISKKVLGRVHSGVIILLCMCFPLILWVLYLTTICGNYLNVFYIYYVG
jgi:hypothetical protein